MVEAKKPVAKKPAAKKPAAAKKPVAAKKPAATKKPAAAKKPVAKKALKGGSQFDLDTVNFSNFNRDIASLEQAAEYKVYLKRQELKQAEKERDQLLGEWKRARLPGMPGVDLRRNMEKTNAAAQGLWPNASTVRGEPASSGSMTSAWANMYGAQLT